MPKPIAQLTDKQKLWLSYYLGEARLNATEAGRLARYKTPQQSGFNNVRNPFIRARIDEELKSRAITGPEVLAHIAEVATSDWKHHINIRVDPRTGEVIEAKMDLNSKIKALELLGKHHQLFTDKVNIGGDFLAVLKAFGRGE